MISNLYSIYDLDTEEYSPLFHSVNDSVAIRQFCLSVKDAPKIYQDRLVLRRCGSFDSSTGFVCTEFCPCEVFLGIAVSDWFAEREKVVKREVLRLILVSSTLLTLLNVSLVIFLI